MEWIELFCGCSATVFVRCFSSPRVDLNQARAYPKAIEEGLVKLLGWSCGKDVTLGLLEMTVKPEDSLCGSDPESPCLKEDLESCIGFEGWRAAKDKGTSRWLLWVATLENSGVGTPLVAWTDCGSLEASLAILGAGVPENSV